MARDSVIKLLLLVILAFILCLPEFFTLHKVLKVNFQCLSYQLCEEKGNQVKEWRSGGPGSAEDEREDLCDPFSTSVHERWEQVCQRNNQSSLLDLALKSWNGDPKTGWIMCESDRDMQELHLSSSSDLELLLEASLELQLSQTENLSLTLYGHSNQDSLQLHLPEERGVDGEYDEGQREVFHCCLPPLPTAKSANQSLCLLWFANQTLLNGTAKEKLPWKRMQTDEWHCVYRAIWLALLCVVLLICLIVVIGQIPWVTRLKKKPKVQSGVYSTTGLQLNGVNHQTKTTTFTDIKPHQFWPLFGLSPIPEDISQEELSYEETDLSYTGNLHHRVHLPPSLLTED
ncbi:hypothetical protein OJAV_G00007200 [Oryzias javanicus]|uniref:Uncharacterized protein n=1 Tax=Oryzias javanicus TaxID=123683 RepID=A0A437DN69_ORYJA|nr:hypothetical protein OJAV_G00007200 [Oryzias javanicus]